MNSVAFSPDGQTLASGSSDSTIRFWEVENGVEFFQVAFCRAYPMGLSVSLFLRMVLGWLRGNKMAVSKY